MYTYEAYLKEINSLSLEAAEGIYEKMLAEIDFNDSDTKEFFNDFIKNSIEYAAIRSRWLTFTREEKMEKDPVRTVIHNSVIGSLDLLSRYLENIGKGISWRVELGEERKRIGDFACYIAFIYGLNGR